MTPVDTESARPLEITDLTVEYTSGGYAVRPLDGFSARVESGELVLLLGASGCGKTTLLSALAAILTPTSGSIRLGDFEVIGLKGSALTRYRRETVGVVFQAFNLVPSLTALENVMLPMRAAGIATRAARERATELLEQVGLGERMTHKPGSMSGGQQQRVAIARALVQEPKILLADEPIASLDLRNATIVMDSLRRINKEDGITVICNLHLLQTARDYCDRIIGMRKGVVVFDGPPAELTEAMAREIYGGGDPGDEEVELALTATSAPRDEAAEVRTGTG